MADPSLRSQHHTGVGPNTRSRRKKDSRAIAKPMPVMYCRMCATIVRLLRRAPGEKYIVERFSYDEMVAMSSCTVHRPMFEEGVSCSTDRWQGVGTAQLRSVPFGFELWMQPGATVHYTRLDSPGLRVHPQWIRSNLIRRWKIRCEKEHGLRCLESNVTSRLPQTCIPWLIDTWRQCLVAPPLNPSYICLSYVWGPCDFLTTTRSNLESLQREGIFSKKEALERIPRTVRDAMAVVCLLGERFLWVDALCIVQDDDDTRHDLINGMASIYGNASLTIIAAQGDDAHYGLRGLRAISLPRSRRQKMIQITRGLKVFQTQERTFRKNPWVDRGWTYQEYMFSSKRLTFINDSVHWHCQCFHWSEDMESDQSAHDTITMGMPIQGCINMTFPDLEYLRTLIGNYKSKKLTYQEDTLPAFAGILSVLSHVFVGKFIQGIPVMYLDIGLTWSGTNQTLRRVSSKSGKSCPPSWSWAGWDSLILSDSDSKDLIKEREGDINTYSSDVQTVPTVTWYSKEHKDEKPKMIHYQNEWYQYKLRFLDKRDNLPTGWTRHDCEPVKNMSLGQQERTHYFSHGSIPGIDFWYPVPLCTPNTAPSPLAHEPILFCTTHRALLLRDWSQTDDQSRVQLSPLYSRSHISLCTLSGVKAGLLIPHGKLAEGHNSYELVAISRGINYLKHPPAVVAPANIARYHIQNGCQRSEFYNVLWVEWIDGIAYRKGSARIFKDVWEAQDLEEIELNLG